MLFAFRFSLLIFPIETVCAAFTSGSRKPCLRTDFLREHPTHRQTDRQTNKQNRAANYSLKTRSFARLTLSISLPFCIDRSSQPPEATESSHSASTTKPSWCFPSRPEKGWSVAAQGSPAGWRYDFPKLGGRGFRESHGWRRRASFHD